MSTPEGAVKDKVKKLFNKYGAYYHMPVQNGMGAPTLDFIACVLGYFFAVETKAPGKHPTPRQQVTMAEMQLSGGFVFVVSCTAELAVLEEWMVMMGAVPVGIPKLPKGTPKDVVQAHVRLHKK